MSSKKRSKELGSPQPSGKKQKPEDQSSNASAEQSTSSKEPFKIRSFEEIKPGMVIYCRNPHLQAITEFCKIKSTRTSHDMRRMRHMELVLEVNTQEKYVVTVMMTSFSGKGSLKEAGVPEDKWKYFIPNMSGKRESVTQALEVASFLPGNTSDRNPGWIIVLTRSKISPNSSGMYRALETELDAGSLNELLELAKSNEQTFQKYVQDQDLTPINAPTTPVAMHPTGENQSSEAAKSSLGPGLGSGKGKKPDRSPTSTSTTNDRGLAADKSFNPPTAPAAMRRSAKPPQSKKQLGRVSSGPVPDYAEGSRSRGESTQRNHDSEPKK